MPAGPAVAQDVLRPAEQFSRQTDAVTESVLVRPRPEYRPQGILMGDLLTGSNGTTRADAEPANGLRKLGRDTGIPEPRNITSDDVTGSFVLRPSVTVEEIYDDNLYRSNSGKRDDLVTLVRPRLRLQSDWYNHALNFEAAGTVARHADNSTEDYEEYTLQAGSKVEVGNGHEFTFALRHLRQHQARDATENVLQALSPSTNLVYQGDMGWGYQGGALSSYAFYRWSRTNALDAGSVDRDDFDYDLHTLTWRGGWEFSPGRTFWIQPEYQIADFRRISPTSGFNRDNRGWSLLSGLTFDVSAVTFLEFGVGLVNRSFDATGKGDLNDFAYEGRFVWNVTPLVSLDAAAGRSVTIDDSAIASASLNDSFSITAAWDPLENLIVRMDLGYLRTDYQSLPGFARKDDTYDVGLRVRYLLNENLFVEAGYAYKDRESSVPTNGFVDNLIRLQVALEL